MVGIPRSGKSFFAEQFAEMFKAPIISFDRLRRELFNEPTFGDEEDEIINRVADYMLEEVFKTGQTIIYEGMADTRNDRTVIAKKARDAGYEPLLIWTQTELATAKKRAIKPNNEQLFVLSADQFELKAKKFSTPHQIEKTVVISGKHTFVSQLKIVLKYLTKSRIPTGERPETKRPSISRDIPIR
jgi:predicted kinase